MANSYLDKAGLEHLWAHVNAYVGKTINENAGLKFIDTLTGNLSQFDATDIVPGIYTIENITFPDEITYYGTFIQYPGVYHVQKFELSKSGDTNTSVSYSRRWLTGSSSWSAWSRYVNGSEATVGMTLNTGVKAYLIGSTTSPSTTAKNVSTIADTGVYLTSTAGELYAKQLNSPKIVTTNDTTMYISSSSTLYVDSGSTQVPLIFRQGTTEKARFNTSGNFEMNCNTVPKTDNNFTLGTSANNWSSIFAHKFSIDASGQSYASLKINTTGTTTTEGAGRLVLGNSLAAGTDKNAHGEILLYAANSYYTLMKMHPHTANRTFWFRDHGNTAYNVATLTVDAVGGEDTPVYINDKGVAVACTSITASSAGKDGVGNVIADTYLKISGGTVTGEVNSSTEVATSSAAFRNIKVIAPGTEIIPGTTAIPTGELWVRYEE